ncbi:hypothetical protein N7451_007767 [Penicillium sp. IBT 35674x]|nr:hypothetical protein N7451_007767 [Penicillium sp. IBT 35674x]
MLELLEDAATMEDHETQRDRSCRIEELRHQYQLDITEMTDLLCDSGPDESDTESPTPEPATTTGSNNQVATSPPSASPSPQASVTNGGRDSAVSSESPITQQRPKSPAARKAGLCMPCFKLWRTPIEARVGKIPGCVLPDIGSRRRKCEGCVERRTACTMIPPEVTERLFKRKESLKRCRAQGRDTAHDAMFLEQQYFIVMEKLEKKTVGVVNRKRQRPASMDMDV